MRLAAAFLVVLLVGCSHAPPRPTPPPAITATVGNMTYTITDFGLRPRFGRGVAVGEYVVLRLVVQNISSSAATVTNSDFKLGDNSGNDYPAVDFPYSGEFSNRQVNPGKSIRGTLVFDVPANTAPTDYTIQLWGNADDVSQDVALP